MNHCHLARWVPAAATLSVMLSSACGGVAGTSTGRVSHQGSPASADSEAAQRPGEPVSQPRSVLAADAEPARGPAGCSVMVGFRIAGQDSAASTTLGSDEEFAVTAKNITNQPVTLRMEWRCPHAPVQWTGFGSTPLDTSRHCLMGMCAQEKLHRAVTIAPGQTADLYRQQVLVGKHSCYEIAPGSYDVSFTAQITDASALCNEPNSVRLSVR